MPRTDKFIYVLCHPNQRRWFRGPSPSSTTIMTALMLMKAVLDLSRWREVYLLVEGEEPPKSHVRHKGYMKDVLLCRTYKEMRSKNFLDIR